MGRKHTRQTSRTARMRTRRSTQRALALRARPSGPRACKREEGGLAAAACAPARALTCSSGPPVECTPGAQPPGWTARARSWSCRCLRAHVQVDFIHTPRAALSERAFMLHRNRTLLRTLRRLCPFQARVAPCTPHAWCDPGPQRAPCRTSGPAGGAGHAATATAGCGWRQVQRKFGGEAGVSPGGPSNRTARGRLPLPLARVRSAIRS